VRIAGIEPAREAASAPAPAGSAASGAAPVAPAAPAASLAEGGGRTGGGGNPASEFRARLVTQLQLTPAQIEKVDAIYAESRPRFMQLRDLPAEERPKARERITADIRARIGDLLTPEQKPRYAALVTEAVSRTVTRGRVYLLGDDGQPRAYNVRLGISDGTATELLVNPNAPDAQVLKLGARVVTGVGAVGGATTPQRTPTGPRSLF
jgi:HlyD family secretion protein